MQALDHDRRPSGQTRSSSRQGVSSRIAAETSPATSRALILQLRSFEFANYAVPLHASQEEEGRLHEREAGG
jgi:hypothetical protein